MNRTQRLSENNMNIKKVAASTIVVLFSVNVIAIIYSNLSTKDSNNTIPNSFKKDITIQIRLEGYTNVTRVKIGFSITDYPGSLTTFHECNKTGEVYVHSGKKKIHFQFDDGAYRLIGIDSAHVTFRSEGIWVNVYGIDMSRDIDREVYSRVYEGSDYRIQIRIENEEPKISLILAG